MNTQVIANCDLLAQNRAAIHQAFKWDGVPMLLAGSSFYVGMGLHADIDRLKESEEILKSNTGLFSEYRSYVKLPLLCKMAVSADPLRYLNDIETLVDGMRKLKWKNHAYKVLAAMIIYDHTAREDSAAVIERMTEIYTGMDRTHPFLTSAEDLPFAAMLAVTDFAVESLLENMEACYKILSKRFFSKNAVQSLTHILSLYPESAEEKCAKVLAIFDGLKEQKHKFGSEYELTVLGSIAMLDLPAETIVEEIIEADENLKTRSGFGNLTMGEYVRRMYAALMVMDAHVPPATPGHAAALNSALIMVIAAEICMIVIMSTMMTTTVTQ